MSLGQVASDLGICTMKAEEEGCGRNDMRCEGTWRGTKLELWC